MQRVTGREREELRAAYLPERVRLLFVGESPPASGRFFYAKDSGLYRALRDAFESDDDHFLDEFRARGCYLVDLAGQPVDDLDPVARRRVCRDGEERLAGLIERLQPEMMAVLLRSIAANVRRAVALAQWGGELLELSYPGRWVRHREAFVAALRPHLVNRFPRPGTRAGAPPDPPGGRER